MNSVMRSFPDVVDTSCRDSSIILKVGHNGYIFKDISLLVVVKLSLVTKNFLLVKKVGLVCGMSYLFYIMKSFVPLCYCLLLFIFLFFYFYFYIYFFNVCDW